MKTKPLDRETILAELRKLKPELSQRFGVSRLALFGSFVRGEAKEESDIDIVIELDHPNLFAPVHIKDALQKDLKRPVDVVRYRPAMNPFLKARIDQEAVNVRFHPRPGTA